MKTITPAQLVVLLAKVKGAKPLTISAFVEAKTNKTAIMRRAKGTDGKETLIATGSAGLNAFNKLPPAMKADHVLKENPFAVVRKLSRVNGMTACDYEASVNRQRDREGTEPAFEAKERAWGERVSGALVENKGQWYLPIHIRATSEPVYFTKQKEGAPYMLTPKTAVAAFLPPKKDEGAAQGVESAIIYRNYALSSIARIAIDGEDYRIRHEPSAQPESKPAKVAKVKSELIDTLNQRRERIEARQSSGLRAALNRKLGKVNPDDPMDEGLHPMDQGEHGDHDRD